MCETKTRAEYWRNAVKLESSSVQKLGVKNVVIAIAYGEDGTVGIFYPDIENEQEVVTPVPADKVWQRLNNAAEWRNEYQAFAFPPWASEDSAFLVATCTNPTGHDVPTGPLRFPPKR